MKHTIRSDVKLISIISGFEFHSPRNLHLRANFRRQEALAKIINAPTVRPAHAKDMIPTQLDKARHEVGNSEIWTTSDKLRFVDQIARLNKKVMESWDEADWPWDAKALEVETVVKLANKPIQGFMEHMFKPRVTVSKNISENAQKGKYAYFPWFSALQLETRLENEQGRLVTQLQRNQLNQNMKDFMAAELIAHSLDKVKAALAIVPIECKPVFHPVFPFQINNPISLLQYWAHILQGKLSNRDAERFLVDDLLRAQRQQARIVANDAITPDSIAALGREYSLANFSTPVAEPTIWVAETTDGSESEED